MALNSLRSIVPLSSLSYFSNTRRESAGGPAIYIICLYFLNQYLLKIIRNNNINKSKVPILKKKNESGEGVGTFFLLDLL